MLENAGQGSFIYGSLNIHGIQISSELFLVLKKYILSYLGVQSGGKDISIWVQWKESLTFASSDALWKNMPGGTPGGPKMVDSHQARNNCRAVIYHAIIFMTFMRYNTI